MKEVDVAIVGGGITGILAARKLMEYGIDVLVMDKSKGVGGRLATRRINGGRADHGAQFFTVRTEMFQQLVDQWEKNQWVSKWFGESHARYKATGGMNQLVKNLASEVPLHVLSKVERIEKKEEGYLVIPEKGEQVWAKKILLTPPAPQSLQLLEASEVLMTVNATQTLQQIAFNPALVGLVTLKDGANTRLPLYGHQDQNLPEGIERVVDSHAKGISEESILSIYATADFSNFFYKKEDDVILTEMLHRLAYLTPDVVVAKQLKRWRYAQADSVYPNRFLQVTEDEGIYVAGDAFLHHEDQSGRTRIESAVMSGLSVAEEIHDSFSRRASM
ncbi:MAG: FAD-dependent oxidoreductase [Anaerobacillus sp.]